MKRRSRLTTMAPTVPRRGPALRPIYLDQAAGARSRCCLEPQGEAERLLEVRAAAAVLMGIETTAQLAAQTKTLRQIDANTDRKRHRVAREAVARIIRIVQDALSV